MQVSIQQLFVSAILPLFAFWVSGLPQVQSDPLRDEVGLGEAGVFVVVPKACVLDQTWQFTGVPFEGQTLGSTETTAFIAGPGFTANHSKELSLLDHVSAVCLAKGPVDESVLRPLGESSSIEALALNYRAKPTAQCIETLAKFKQLRRLDLMQLGVIDNKCWTHLKSIKQLRALDVRGTSVTAEALVAITDCITLESISMYFENEMTGVHTRALSILTELRYMDVSNASFGNLDTDYRLPSKLEKVRLTRCRSVGRIVIDALSRLAALRWLEIADPQDFVDSEALSHLALPKSIEVLGLVQCTSVKAESLRRALSSASQAMRSIDVRGMALDEQCLQLIRKFKCLETLRLGGTCISATELKGLLAESTLIELDASSLDLDEPTYEVISQMKCLTSLTIARAAGLEKGLLSIVKSESLKTIWISIDDKVSDQVAKLAGQKNIAIRRMVTMK